MKGLLKLNKFYLLLLVLIFTTSALVYAEVIEVDLWHGFSGARMDVLSKIVDDFNALDPGRKIVPMLYGSYEEGLARFLAAHPIQQEPALFATYEGSMGALHDSNMIIPAYKIPEIVGAEWDFGQYVRPIVSYYSKDGNLWSWPMASSVQIIYYNADHLRQAGLDPNKPPTTWDELHQYGLQLLETGVCKHPLVLGWPDAVFENQLCTHNLEYCDQGNGREGHSTKVYWPNEFTDKLMSKWSEMAKDGVWAYGGVEYDVNGAFQAGEATFLHQSTSSLNGILKTVGDDFEVKTTFVPRLNDDYPQGNSFIGGSSLYVSNQASQEEIEVIFEFFQYLARPEVDVWWHKNTGYFPSTNAGLRMLMDSGWFVESPNHLTAFLQILSGKTDSNAAIGMKLGTYVQAREWCREAIEKISRGEDQRQALEYSAAQINKIFAEYNEFFKD